MLLLNGDCIEEMQKLIDDGKQVDSVVTDPPYHLTSIVERYGKEGSAPAKDRDGLYQRQARGFMGKEWDGGDIAFRKETWELAYKLLKPGGHLLAFSASRNYHRMAVAIEDAGFEIRDQLMWLYGSGFPKSHNLGDGWGTALKPAHEPIVMARKFIEGTNKNNREKYGTGGINIDGCRIELSEGDDPRLGGKGTWKTDGMAKNVYGDYKGRENGSSELGRFPANVMHDGSEEVVSGFPNAKGAVSNGDASVGETSEGVIKPLRRGKLTSYADDGSAARFFYCPKVSKSERGEDNTHPTVKPQELMKYLCRLVTPKGGTVLDPFMGSGSTGMAAKDEEFKFIGIEKEKEYFEIAESRITRFAPLMNFM